MTEAKWMPGERESWKPTSDEETAGLFQDIRDGLDDIYDELDYLKWFKQHADFGPADSDVHQIMDMQYEEETGKTVPTDWAQEGE
jgi:hypothetical protein